MCEVDAVNVVNQTFFCFYKLNINGLNLSDGKLLLFKFLRCILPLRLKNQHELLNKTERRINRHLDVVHFIKKTMAFDTLIKYKMSKEER